MRILHFDSDSLGTPYSGGQARRTYEINKRLAQRHEVTVVTAGFKTLRRQCIDGIQYIRMLSLPHPMNFIWYFVELLPRALLARADVIVEDFSSPLTASAAPLLLRRRPIVGIASYFFGRQAAQRYRLPIDRWEASAVGVYRNLIALSQTQAEQLRRFAPRADIKVIPNGADDEAFAHPWCGDQPYVAFIGRLDAHMKGLDLLLQASRELPGDLLLRIAGDGPGRRWLEREIAVRGLSARVAVVGRLEGGARHDFLAHAKALAFSSRYENQSLVGLDALAIGVPTVAFDVPSSRELFSGAALLIEPFDVGAFGRALARVASESAVACSLSSAAKIRAQGFRWDVSARTQEQFYSDVLAAGAVASP
jgi:glycosyltransferase involved in cell wall biosynthesis